MKHKRKIKTVVRPAQFCKRGQDGYQKIVSLQLPCSHDLPTTAKGYISMLDQHTFFWDTRTLKEY